jgi:hypothetical protein
MEGLKDGTIISKDFRNFFPEDVYELIIQISRQGFGLTLVGGAVRDYFINGSLSKDLDFELRHSFEYSEEEWEKLVKRLGESLKNKYLYSVEFLPFNILKIKQGHYELELSTPRTEKYQGQGPYGHSEFDVIIDPKLSYAKSFLRRDFTLNALGIEFGAPGSSDEFKFVDPFNGLEDLKKRVLKPCSDDFYSDPVRLLRTLRFQGRFGFSFEGDFSRFDLSCLTSHYFFQECLHDFFPLAREFFKTVKKENVLLASDLHDLNFLAGVNLGHLGELSKLEVLILLTFFDKENDLAKREVFVRLAGLKLSTAGDYENFKILLYNLKHLNNERIVRKLRNKNFVELLDDEDLINMKSLYGVYNKHRFTELNILNKVDEEAFGLYLYFNNLFGEETKGRSVASKLMKLVTQNEKRSVITIYCHLLVHFDLRPVLPESRFGN